MQNEFRRYNAKPCKVCGTAFSVKARHVGREFFDEHGAHVGLEHVIGDWSMLRAPCRSCGKIRVARVVLGVMAPAIKCDGRCMAATGHTCECSCGGMNHGAIHG